MARLAPILLLLTSLSAAPPDVWQPECWCAVENVEVIDADTVKGDIVLPFANVVLRRQTIRAQGFDAWETSKRRRVLNLTEEQWRVELQRGAKSKAEFAEFLNGGRLYVAPIPEHEDIDPYERIDARWLIVKDGIPYRAEEVARQKGWVRK